jgi:DNA-directed RNA polymerase specialized sigma24 family protein
MNAALCGNTQEQFVTAAYVHVDSAICELRYSGAAHAPMLLLRRGQISKIEDDGLMLDLQEQCETSESIVVAEHPSDISSARFVRTANCRCRVSMAKDGKNNVVSGAYATAADFKQIFTEDVDSLYLLSLLLTADHEKAEECFVGGIGESTKGNRVFKEWARSWARRSIIQSAIRLIDPRQQSVTAIRTGDVARMMYKVPMFLHAEVHAILELAPLERFVFVMSVLERFSDHDCSILLGLARRDVAAARVRAMQRLVTLFDLEHNRRPDEYPETVIELTVAQHFATPEWTRSLSQ